MHPHGLAKKLFKADLSDLFDPVDGWRYLRLRGRTAGRLQNKHLAGGTIKTGIVHLEDCDPVSPHTYRARFCSKIMKGCSVTPVHPENLSEVTLC